MAVVVVVVAAAVVENETGTARGARYEYCPCFQWLGPPETHTATSRHHHHHQRYQRNRYAGSRIHRNALGSGTAFLGPSTPATART